MQLESEVELNYSEYTDWILDSSNPTIMTDRFIETYKEMNEYEFKEFINQLVKQNSPF